jgi:hypothetical protein
MEGLGGAFEFRRGHPVAAGEEGRDSAHKSWWLLAYPFVCVL